MRVRNRIEGRRWLGIALPLCTMFVTVTVTADAEADAAGPPRTWQFQNTGFSAVSPFTAVAMRSGLTWPVIFNNGSPAVGLRATENPGTGTFWFEEGPAISGSLPVVGKSSPDGRVVVATPGSSPGVRVGGSFQNPNVHPDAAAGAFDGQGTLHLAEDDNVIGLDPIPNLSSAPIVDIAIAPDGTTGVVTSNGRYHEHRFGAWGASAFPLGAAVGRPVGGALRMTFDEQSRPHVVDVHNGQIGVFSFETQQGDWTYTNLGSTHGAPFTTAPIAATDGGPRGGEVGVAWVNAADDALEYSSRDSTGQWITETVTAGVDGGFLRPDQTVGLTFDAEGLPVISFQQDGQLWLAHDPVLVEPVPGDLNGDGNVDGLDIDPFVRVLTGGEPFNPAADLNADGGVDGLDIDPFVKRLTGAGVNADGISVPEPTALMLLTLATLTVPRQGRFSGLGNHDKRLNHRNQTPRNTVFRT